MSQNYNAHSMLHDAATAAYPGAGTTAIAGSANCTKISMPSIGMIVLVLIISWIFYMAVAYAIYWFFRQVFPATRFNYWIILLLLIIAGLVAGLISNLLFRFFVCPELAKKL